MILSLLKKDIKVILLNIGNLILSVFYLNYQANFLEDKFNASFAQSVIVPDKFYQYLGLYQISVIMLVVIIQVWFINLYYLNKKLKR